MVTDRSKILRVAEYYLGELGCNVKCTFTYSGDACRDSNRGKRGALIEAHLLKHLNGRICPELKGSHVKARADRHIANLGKSQVHDSLDCAGVIDCPLFKLNTLIIGMRIRGEINGKLCFASVSGRLNSLDSVAFKNTEVSGEANLGKS